jgi:outer membrane biogenesis lipoprotein LolB
MKASRLVLSAAIPLLSACGVAAKVNARNDLEQSKTAYKQCLAQHADDESKCTASRAAYLADLQTYEALSRGIRSAPSVSVEQSN